MWNRIFIYVSINAWLFIIAEKILELEFLKNFYESNYFRSHASEMFGGGYF